MALYGTPVQQVQQTQPQGPSMWSGFSAPSAAGGAVAGAAAVETYAAFQKVKTAATVGFWGTIALGGLALLEGNQAQPLANTAMAQANSITAGSSYAQADAVASRLALQNLAQAVQNLTPGGYTGLSTNTMALATPSSPVPAATTNNGWLILLGIGLIVVVAVK